MQAFITCHSSFRCKKKTGNYNAAWGQAELYTTIQRLIIISIACTPAWAHKLQPCLSMCPCQCTLYIYTPRIQSPGYEDGKGCCEGFFGWEEDGTSGVDNVGMEDQPIDCFLRNSEKLPGVLLTDMV